MDYNIQMQDIIYFWKLYNRLKTAILFLNIVVILTDKEYKATTVKTCLLVNWK